MSKRIVTREQFIKKLRKAMSKDYVIYDNKDHCFEHLEDGELAFCGEDEEDTFAMLVVKVFPDE